MSIENGLPSLQEIGLASQIEPLIEELFEHFVSADDYENEALTREAESRLGNIIFEGRENFLELFRSNLGTHKPFKSISEERVYARRVYLGLKASSVCLDLGDEQEDYVNKANESLEEFGLNLNMFLQFSESIVNGYEVERLLAYQYEPMIRKIVLRKTPCSIDTSKKTEVYFATRETLANAVRNYNPQKFDENNKFITYAWSCASLSINNHILDAIRPEGINKAEFRRLRSFLIAREIVQEGSFDSEEDRLLEIARLMRFDDRMHRSDMPKYIDDETEIENIRRLMEIDRRIRFNIELDDEFMGRNGDRHTVERAVITQEEIDTIMQALPIIDDPDLLYILDKFGIRGDLRILVNQIEGSGVSFYTRRQLIDAIKVARMRFALAQKLTGASTREIGEGLGLGTESSRRLCRRAEEFLAANLDERDLAF